MVRLVLIYNLRGEIVEFKAKLARLTELNKERSKQLWKSQEINYIDTNKMMN